MIHVAMSLVIIFLAISPNNNYPMDDLDAGPSGVHHDTPMPYSPPPIPHLLPLGLHSEGDVVSALSVTCHSQQIAEHVDQIG